MAKGYRYKKFNGESYHDRGWTRFKVHAIDFAKSLRKEGYKVRIVSGRSSKGDMGYRVWSRKQHS